MAQSQTIIIEQHPEYFHIRLNAIATKNALTLAMINQLSQSLIDIEESDSSIPILLTGNGSDFCAGADINWFKQSIQNDEETNYNEAKKLYELFNHLNTIANPTVCCVQGHIFGGGLGLVCCCDYALSSANARFCFSEVRIGLIPATIMSFVINKIGISAARSLMISAKLFDARHALITQLIHEICPHEQFDQSRDKLIKDISKNGPQAMLATKQQLLSMSPNYEKNADNAIASLAKIRQQTEAQEGMQAFLDKRLPKWHSMDN